MTESTNSGEIQGVSSTPSVTTSSPAVADVIEYRGRDPRVRIVVAVFDDGSDFEQLAASSAAVQAGFRFVQRAGIDSLPVAFVAGD